MDALVVVLAVVGMLATLAATLLMFTAGWRGFRGGLSRVPEDRRKRAIAGGVIGALLAIGTTMALIAEPFGRPTILVVAGAYVLVIFALLGLQAVLDIRAVKARRPHTK